MTAEFFACDIWSGAVIERLPATGSWSDAINAPGGANLAMSSTEVPYDYVRENHVGLRVIDAGVDVWGGIAKTFDVDIGPDGTSLWRVGYLGWWDHFRRIEVDEDREYAQIDEATIADELVTYAQAKDADLDLGVLVANPGTGRLVDVTVKAGEGRKVGAVVEEMAARAGGCEFAIGGGMDEDGEFVRRFRLVPTLGSDTDLVFDPTTCRAMRFKRDGTKTARRWTARSGGHAEDVAIARRRDESLAGRVPRYEESRTYGEIVDFAALEAHADADLATARIGGEQLTVELLVGFDETVRIGDRVTVILDDLHVRGWYRVVGVSTSVDDVGRSTQQVELRNMEALP